MDRDTPDNARGGGVQGTGKSGARAPEDRRFPRVRDVLPLISMRGPRITRRARLSSVQSLEDLRRRARSATPRAVFDYVDGGAGAESSLRHNREAFADWDFLPRVLRDVSVVDSSTSILGVTAALPVILAPTGFTRMMHYAGESAVARAAAEARLPYVLSTLGTTSPGQISKAAPAGNHWFQLYLWKDRHASRELLSEAAEAGFKTLVLTVDTPVMGARLRDARNGLTIPPSLTLRTLLGMTRRPKWWINLLTTEPLRFASLSSTDGALASMVDRTFDASVSLRDLDWLRSEWPGAIVVKGVLRADDAKDVVGAGANAVALSNHGGRQLDRAVAPLRQVSEVRQAIGGAAELYVDSGITSGADVVTALALGADACLVGRYYLYGLMAGGEAGVSTALELLSREIRRTMQLLGVSRLVEIDSSLVRLREES